MRRLVREAHSASALNHPNIIIIQEVAEANGTHYIATEFIDGTTLRERMSQGLEFRVILDIAIQLASGLRKILADLLEQAENKPVSLQCGPDLRRSERSGSDVCLVGQSRSKSRREPHR